MSVLSTFSTQEFNTQREQWENILRAELKLPEIGNKASKNSIDGGSWPILSLERREAKQMPVHSNWKKAAQSYIVIDPSTIEAEIEDDLIHGVRNFFFVKEFLTPVSWKKISAILSKYNRAAELEVFLLGNSVFDAGNSGLKVIDEAAMVTGRVSHDHGGNCFQELSLLTVDLIEKIETPDPVIYLGVFTDAQFFRNIAKIRAAKLLALKVMEESGIKKEIAVVALTSFREWTLYERYSNMLRNDSAVASAFIGGADHVQSTGYNSLFELEAGVPSDSEHRERTLRMARNTSHILALESMLGVVQDAAYGSYHLENLTQNYAELAWKEMQKLLPLKAENRKVHVLEECQKVRESRLQAVRTRRHVLAGMNDFPDAKEKLNLTKAPVPKFFRVAHEFESLRLKMELIPVKPEVYIGLFGEYAALNARLNFVKNYFQMLGLEVHEVTETLELKNKQGIVVICGLDDHYPSLKLPELAATDRFIAGKYEMPGFKNLFAGQNVYEVLEGIVKRWGNK